MFYRFEDDMIKLQILALCIAIASAVFALLCYATTWAEPRDYDPVPPKKRDLVDFDEERL